MVQNKSRLGFVVIALCLLGIVVSCAGSPEAAEGDMIQVSLLTDRQIRNMYGTELQENPFLPPVGLFTRSKMQFFVLRFEGSSEYINIEDVKVRYGDIYAKSKIYGPEELKAFWEARDTDTDEIKSQALLAKKYRTISTFVIDPYKPFRIKTNLSKVMVIVSEIPSESEAVPILELAFNNGQESFSNEYTGVELTM